MKESTRARWEAERKEALDAYVKKMVDEWPPLTREQRDRLGMIIARSSEREAEAGALAQMMED